MTTTEIYKGFTIVHNTINGEVSVGGIKRIGLTVQQIKDYINEITAKGYKFPEIESNKNEKDKNTN